jgi:hypothetical protein
VSKDGRPIAEARARHSIRTGITYGTLLTGAVPEYEEREAARFGLYRWRQWCRLGYWERVNGLVHYRLHRLIELHENDVLAEHADREAKKGSA